MIKYQKEKLSKELMEEIIPFALDQADDTDISLDVHIGWSRYMKAQELEILQLYTARLNGELIGYASFMVQPHMHYMDTSVGACDILYVTRQARNLGCGTEIIKFVEDDMKAMKVGFVTISVKENLDFSPLLLENKYDLHERVYIKILGD